MCTLTRILRQPIFIGYLTKIAKISVLGKEFVGVIIEGTDSYSWDVYFTGYYHDVIVCGMSKKDEFTDDGTYEVIDENALAKDVYEKLDEKAEKEHKHTKDEITDFNHTHTVSEISDLDISSFADKEHKHTKDDITTHRYIDNLHNLKSIVPYSLPESFILKI